MPIRFKHGGAAKYAIITGYSGTTLTIAGAALTAATEITELAVGTPEMLHTERFHLPGPYGSGQGATGDVENDFLANNQATVGGGATERQGLLWELPKAYLVTFRATHYQTPVPTTAPNFTPRINGANVSSQNTNTGPLLSTPNATFGTWVDNSPVEINTSNYAISRDQALTVSFKSGSSNLGEDFNIVMVFVFE